MYARVVMRGVISGMVEPVVPGSVPWLLDGSSVPSKNGESLQPLEFFRPVGIGNLAKACPAFSGVVKFPSGGTNPPLPVVLTLRNPKYCELLGVFLRMFRVNFVFSPFGEASMFDTLQIRMHKAQTVYMSFESRGLGSVPRRGLNATRAYCDSEVCGRM